MTTSAIQNTSHRQIWGSDLGQAVEKNKILSGFLSAGTAVALYGLSQQSPMFSKILDKGIMPALGVMVARLGVAAMEDAMVNDWQENKTRARGKLALGTLATLGGTEMVGDAYDIKVARKALSGTLDAIVDNLQSLVGGGLILGGVKAGEYAWHARQAPQRPGENGQLASAKALCAGVGSTVASLAGVQMIGDEHNIPVARKALTGTVEFIADSKMGMGATGAALVGGGLISANQAVKNIKKGGNEFASAGLLNLALGSALGGTELVGCAANIPQLENMFIDNVRWLQGLGISSTGFAWANNAKNRIQNDALTGTRGLEVAAALATAFSGLALATAHISKPASEQLTSGATLGVSVGLLLAAAGFAKQAKDALGNQKPEAGFMQGTLAVSSGVGSLMNLGELLESRWINKVSHVIESRTLEPLMEHVIVPALTYLYDNPIEGGLLLTVVAGAMLHGRARHNEPIHETVNEPMNAPINEPVNARQAFETDVLTN